MSVKTLRRVSIAGPEFRQFPDFGTGNDTDDLVVKRSSGVDYWEGEGGRG